MKTQKYNPSKFEDLWKIDTETMHLLNETQNRVFKKEGYKYDDILKDHLMFTCEDNTYNLVPEDKLKHYKEAYKQIEKSKLNRMLKYNYYIKLTNRFVADVQNYADDAPIEFVTNYYYPCGEYGYMTTKQYRESKITSVRGVIDTTKLELQKGKYVFATINTYNYHTKDFTDCMTEISINNNDYTPSETNYNYRIENL